MKKQKLIAMLLSAVLAATNLVVMAPSVSADAAGEQEIALTQGGSALGWTGITAQQGAATNKYLRVENITSSENRVWFYVPTTPGTEYNFELKLRNDAGFNENAPIQYRLVITNTGDYAYFNYDNGDANGWMTVSIPFTANSEKTAIYLRGGDIVNNACIPFEVDDLRAYAVNDESQANVIWDDTGMWTPGTANAYDFSHLGDGVLFTPDLGVCNWNVIGKLLDYNTNEILRVMSETYYATADNAVDNSIVAEYTAKMTLQPGEYTLSGMFRVSDYQTKRILIAPNAMWWGGFEPANPTEPTPYAIFADYNMIDIGMALYNGEEEISVSANTTVNGEFAAVSHTFTVTEPTDITKIVFTGANGIDFVNTTDDPAWGDMQEDGKTPVNINDVWYSDSFGMPVIKSYVQYENGNYYLRTLDQIRNDVNIWEALAGKIAPAAIPFDMDDVMLTTENGTIERVDTELSVGEAYLDDGRINAGAIALDVAFYASDAGEASVKIYAGIGDSELAEVSEYTVEAVEAGVLNAVIEVEKNSIRNALGKADIDGCVLYVQVNGGAIEQSVYVEDKVSYGDANGDDAVNPLDLVYLQRNLANWGDYDDSVVNKTLLDLNCDGAVDMKDAVALAKYIAKWIGFDNILNMTQTAE